MIPPILKTARFTGLVIGPVMFFVSIVSLAQGDPAPGRPTPTPEDFSPLGYLDLLAYQQAYPATVRYPELIRASLQKYWAFRGIAYRGRTATGGVWTSLGPETSIQNPDEGGTETISGRVHTGRLSGGAAAAWAAGVSGVEAMGSSFGTVTPPLQTTVTMSGSVEATTTH